MAERCNVGFKKTEKKIRLEAGVVHWNYFVLW